MSGSAHIGGNLLVDGTITGTIPVTVDNLTATWNNAGTQFFGIRLTVTDTASLATSQLLTLNVGASTLFAIRKDGAMVTPLTLTSITANLAQLVVSGFSLTGANAQTMASFAGTWNTSASPTAFLLNITNTASAVGSRVVDVQVSAASAFRIITAAVGASVTVFGNFFVNAPNGSGTQYFDVSTSGAGMVNVRTTIMRMFTTSFQFQMSSGSVLWCNTDSADTPVPWSADFVGRVLCFGVRIKQHLSITVAPALQLDGQVYTAAANRHVSITGGWNGGAQSFIAFLVNITDTASLATSLLCDWQLGGASRFAVGKGGTAFITTAADNEALIIATSAVNRDVVRITAPAFTVDVNIFDVAATWNNGAVSFIAFLLNITNTASAAGSRLMELQLGGAQVFAVQKDGVLLIASTSGPGAAAGTLTNAPSVGDPDAWVPIIHNGTAMWVPAWGL